MSGYYDGLRFCAGTMHDDICSDADVLRRMTLRWRGALAEVNVGGAHDATAETAVIRAAIRNVVGNLAAAEGALDALSEALEPS